MVLTRIKFGKNGVSCDGVPGDQRGFGDELEVDIDSGLVKNLTTGEALNAEALPPNIQHILKQGGSVEVMKAKLAAMAT